MTTIPSDVYPNADKLTEEEKTDFIQATVAEIKKYFNIVPAENKQLRGHDVSRSSTPGVSANEDIRILMAFLKALYNALFNGEWADSDTLELAPSGKIRVKVAALSSGEADGITIVKQDGKLTVDLTNVTDAARKKISQYLVQSGGGLSTDPTTGELNVDLADLTVEQVWALCEPGGGLAVDTRPYLQEGDKYTERDGLLPGETYEVTEAQAQQTPNGFPNPNYKTLLVDFGSMDPLMFAKTMSDMIDAQKLSSADGKNQFYVDGTNGDDDEPSTRGTPDKPFKTIQACVDFITKVYKFVDTDAYINCQNISQTTPLVLPSYDRTTARITVRGATFTASTTRSSPTVETGYSIVINYAPTSGTRNAVSCIGTGVWTLRNLDVSTTDASLSGGSGHLAALRVSDYASVEISRCRFKTTRSSQSPWQYSRTTGEHVIRANSFASLEIDAYCAIVGDDISTSSVVISDGEHDGTYTRLLNGISVSDNASVSLTDLRDQTGSGGADKRLVVSGSFSRVFNVSGSVSRNRAYMGTIDYSGIDNADYKFYIASGGHVYVSDSGTLDGTTHGDTYLGTDTTNDDGTTRTSYAETSTYSWYK